MRLRNFIRRRVPDPSDAEDILQDVFYKLVEANRLLMPIDHVTGWLFRVARNRITDLFRKKTAQWRSATPGSRTKTASCPRLRTCCHRPMRGRKRSTFATLYSTSSNWHVDELPTEQREVFVAHESKDTASKRLPRRPA